MAEPNAAISSSGSFADLKQLLAKHGDIGPNAEVPLPIKMKALSLCADYLGGAWKQVGPNGITLRRMSGGMSNVLFHCSLNDATENNNDVQSTADDRVPALALLRVYFNPETESHLVAESVIFTLLSERQLGPRLFGIFNGGRLEEYIDSRPFASAEIQRPSVSVAIARKLAKVHTLQVPISKEPTYLCDALDRWVTHLLDVVCQQPKVELKLSDHARTIDSVTLRCEIETIRWISTILTIRKRQKFQRRSSSNELTQKGQSGSTKQTGLWFDLSNNVLEAVASTSATVIEASASGDATDVGASGAKKARRVATVRPQPISRHGFALTDLPAELEIIKSCLRHSRSPVLFCHNDLQEGNILLPEGLSEDDLVFIDFEYASYNYRAFDFANHFCEWTINYDVKEPPYYNISLDEFPTEADQARFIGAYLETQGLPADAAAVAAAIEETRAFVPLSHFLWGVWALLQVELSPVTFGFAEYARDRLSLYFEHKADLLRLIQRSPEEARQLSRDGRTLDGLLGRDVIGLQHDLAVASAPAMKGTNSRSSNSINAI